MTRNLPASDAAFEMHVEEARQHFEALCRQVPARDPGEAILYEFGAGWDLIGPVTLAMLGVRRQMVVDIRAHLRLELVNDTLRRLPGLIAEPRCSPEPLAAVDELGPGLGIEYIAPCDARDRDADGERRSRFEHVHAGAHP